MRKALSLIFMVVIVGSFVSLFVGRADHFIDANIETLLTEGGDTQAASHVSRKNTVVSPVVANLRLQLQDQFVILVSGSDAEGFAKATIQTLQRLPGLVLHSSEHGKKLAEFYWPYRHQLLTEETREELLRLTPEEFARRRAAELLSPASAATGMFGDFTEDPFALHSAWLLGMAARESRVLPTEIPSLDIDQQLWFMILGRVERASLNDESKQFLSSLIAKLPEASEVNQAAQHAAMDYSPALIDSETKPQVVLKISGSIFHMLYGEQISKDEISGIGMVSGLTTLLIMLLFFRGWRSFVLVTVVLCSSACMGFVVTWWWFGNVHAVTLVFGTTLLGLVIDYCFHFLSKYYQYGESRAALLRIRKGLWLGLISSVVAYSVQLFVPLAGVRQFAIFVSAGLITAALSVVVFGGFMPTRKARQNQIADASFDWLSVHLFEPLAQNGKTAKVLFILTTLGLVLIYATYSVQDDIRAMTTSPKYLMDSERFINDALGGFSVGQYMVVSADNDDALLQSLNRLSASADGVELMGVHDFVPTALTQQRDFELVSEFLYGERGAFFHLCRMLALDCTSATRPALFEQLTVEALLAAKLWMPALAVLDHTTVVQIKPRSADDFRLLENAAQSIDGVEYYDDASRITAALSKFRHEISLVLVLFLLLLLPCFWLLFRSRALLLYLPPFICVVWATLAATIGDLSLFHVLALFLVFGLVLDSSAFLLCAGFNADVWWASAMSTATSLVVFGLLQFSAVPMLSQFGLVVFVGLIISLLVTPLLFSMTSHSG